MSYLVVTKGLNHIIEVRTQDLIPKALDQLKQLGYKKPMIFARVANIERQLQREDYKKKEQA